MEQEYIQKAIECWVSRPTWFSSHPSDVPFFREAVVNLKSLPDVPTVDELSAAIYKRVQVLPALMGTPRDLQLASNEFAIKIIAKL
jgi:hypothetical protein